ncbi:MAG: hypothetical protein KJO43_15890 [Phycisphaerae bacterium]|nr:hypothetical protein [Phycisphaerae bacterium]NNF43202.1 hypothetical protein [Phycisphaerales bacterium]
MIYFKHDAPTDIGTQDAARVGILYENDAWLGPLFATLDDRGIPTLPMRTEDAAIHLAEPPPFHLAFNRVSPSSYLRGHGPAIPFARSLLDTLRHHGVRVINGAGAFRYETSKLDQQLLFARLGVATPRTILFNNDQAILAAARAFSFPAIIKPDCGGSGAFVRRVADYEELAAIVRAGSGLFAPDHLLLLQEEVVARDDAVVRTEFIDGEFVYAMRARATNTFNLCPADSCERHAADPTERRGPAVAFEPYLDIPPAAVAQAREIVRAAELDVGGVEFIEDADGVRWFIDINATSVYREDVCKAAGVDANDMLAHFIIRELHKETAKSTVRLRVGARK